MWSRTWTPWRHLGPKCIRAGRRTVVSRNDVVECCEKKAADAAVDGSSSGSLGVGRCWSSNRYHLKSVASDKRFEKYTPTLVVHWRTSNTNICRYRVFVRSNLVKTYARSGSPLRKRRENVRVVRRTTVVGFARHLTTTARVETKSYHRVDIRLISDTTSVFRQTRLG